MGDTEDGKITERHDGRRRPHIELRWKASDFLGELIRRTRYAAGLTQAEVATEYTQTWHKSFEETKQVFTDRWIGRIESEKGPRPWLTIEQVDTLAIALGCGPFQAVQILLASGHLSMAEVLMRMLEITLPEREATYGAILAEMRELEAHDKLTRESAQAVFDRAQAKFVAELATTLAEINRAITSWMETHPVPAASVMEDDDQPTDDHL